MTSYFALWIPTLKVGNIKVHASPGIRKIQDNEMWDPYFLWGEVDGSTYNFTLLYSLSSDKGEAKELVFTHKEHNSHGFIIYSVEYQNTEADAFINVLDQKGLSPSVYQYIKDHFHKHVHHDPNEDALIKCLGSPYPLTLSTEEGKRTIYNYYLNLYSIKISNFLKDAQDDHIRGRQLVNNVLTTSKGISLYADTIKNGRILEGEYEYCKFLMEHYNIGRAQQNKEIRENMEAIRQELASFSFDYNLCTNAYSIKLAVIGILAGVAGILVSTGGIVLSCCSDPNSNSDADTYPIIHHIDSIATKQESRFTKIDSAQEKIINRVESLSTDMQKIRKNNRMQRKRPN